MKILYVLPYKLGALGTKASLEYIIFMKQRNHEILLLHKDPGESKPKDLVDLVFSYNNGWVDCLFAVHSILKEHKPDIVHIIYSNRAFLFPIVPKLFSDSQAKFILDVRSPLLVNGFKKQLFRFISFPCMFLYDLFLSHERHSFYDVFPLHFGKKYSLLGIGTEIAEKRNVLENGAVVRFVYFGSISSKRPINNLIEYFKEYIENKNNNIVFDLYGDGDGVGSLKQQIQGCNEINYRGVINSNISAVLSSYDVGVAYLSEKKYYHAPSLKILDYMSNSLCVLATDTPGNKIHVEHAVDGYLVTNSKESWFAIFDKVLTQHPNIDIRTNAYNKAKKYDWNELLENQLLPIYNSLIARCE